MAERLLKSLAFTLAVFFILSITPLETVAELLAAVVIHEFGHIVALLLMGLHIKGLYVEPSGLRITYVGQSSTLMDILAALAGPLAGLMYSGILFGINTYSLSAEISMVYSFFNLLPIMPLDGGRALQALFSKSFEPEKGEGILLRISLAFSLVLAGLGLAAMLAGEGGGLFAAGIWLLLMQS